MSPLCPKRKRTWLARAGRAARGTGEPAGRCLSPGSGGRALLPSALWLAFQQSSWGRLVFTEMSHGMLGGVFFWCLPQPPGKVCSVASVWRCGSLGSKMLRRLRVGYLRICLLPTIVTHVI